MRVVEDGAEVFRDAGIVFDQAFGEGAVVVETSGDVARVDAVERAWEDRNSAGVDSDGDVGGQQDFSGVADEAEAGDVGHGVDGEMGFRLSAFGFRRGG